MLKLKPCCEYCETSLPYDSEKAMICTFECTFCKNCVEKILFNVCPNCGGGFEKRPIRPASLLNKYPVSEDKVVSPVTTNPYLASNKNIPPKNR